MSILILAATAAAPNQTPTLNPVSHVKVSDDAQMVCPVTGKTIEPGQGVRINLKGHAYVVFDKEAAQELQANPDKYLEEDGTPKNAKKQ